MCAGEVAPLTVGTARASRQLLQARHGGEVGGLSFAPDGVLASASEDGTLRLWDVGSRRLLRVIHHDIQRREERQGALAPGVEWDGAGARLLLKPKRQGPMTLFDRGGAKLQTVATDFALMPSGRGGFRGVRDGRLFSVDLERCTAGTGAGAAPDDDRAVTATVRDHTLTLTGPSPDGTAGTSTSWPLEGDVDAYWGAVASRKGGFAVVSRKGPTSSQGKLSLVSLKDGRPLLDLEDSGGRGTVRVSPDGSTIVQAFSVTAQAWDAATGKVLWRRHSEAMSAAALQLAAMGSAYYSASAFSPDGRTLALGQNDGRIFVIEPRSGRLEGELGKATAHAPTATTFLGDGRLLVLARDHVTLWSLKDASPALSERVRDVFAAGEATPGSLTLVRTLGDPNMFSNAQRCELGKTPVTLEVWSGPTLAARRSSALCLADRPFFQAVHLPSERALVRTGELGHEERGLRVARGDFSVPTGGFAIQRLDGTAAIPLDRSDGVEVDPPELSQDGRWAIGFGGNLRVRPMQFFAYVWDTATGRRVAALPVPEPPAGAPAPPRTRHCDLSARPAMAHPETTGPWVAATSPSGTHVAIAGSSATAVYELPSGRRVRSLARGATAIAFGASDTELVLADTRGGATLELIRDDTKVASADAGAAIRSIAVSPSAKLLATTSPDGGVRVWDLGTLALRGTLVDYDDDEHIAFTPGGAFAGTAEVAERVAWVFDRPDEAFGFEQFASSSRLPELVRRRLDGAAADLSAPNARPPHVTIAARSPLDTPASTAILGVQATSLGQVDAVRAFVEGRAVATKAVCSSRGELELSVPLLPGSNVVTVQAFDAQGFASNPATVRARGPEQGALRPDVWIVAIGVSRYPKLDPRYQLELADDDAREVASAFAAEAGASGVYAHAHSTVLTDEQATLASVEAALSRLSAMKPDDVAVVFLAGHGMKPSPAEDMRFLTSGVEGGPRGARAESVRREGIGWSRIGELLAGARGRVLVLLDACHSGHVSQELVVPNDDLARNLTEQQRAGVLVFAAAKGRQLSYEPSGQRGLGLEAQTAPLVSAGGAHGYFTGAVLASLASPKTDTNGDGAIEASELFAEVTARVHGATRGLQTPWVARRELFGDFHLARSRPAR